MDIGVVQTDLGTLNGLRQLFLQENGIQFVHDKCHRYGWADTYRFTYGTETVGYGSVWGRENRETRDCIFEFFLMKPFRKNAGLFFQEFCAITHAPYIECQTNDPLLSSMFFEHAHHGETEFILFEDHTTTNMRVPGITFRRHEWHNTNPDDMGGFFLEENEQKVASGGLMLNYNFPYADIYMEVEPAFRGKGLGSFLVQELKREAYSAGRVPAARCNARNQMSKGSLLKAGFRICGYLLNGTLTKQ